MIGRLKKKSKAVDLLELSEIERIKLIRKVKESFRQKVAEDKLWKSLADSQVLVINGESVHCPEMSLKGLLYSDLLKSI